MIIYIVTHGSYSSYRIDGAFSSRGAAETFIEENKWEDGDGSIEEYTLDQESPPSTDHHRVRVLMDEGGNVIEATVDTRVEHNLFTITAWTWIRRAVFDKQCKPAKGTMKIEFTGTVWARDAKHAIKMAGDARAASIAAGDLDKLKAGEERRYTWQPMSVSWCYVHTDCIDDMRLAIECAKRTP